MVPERLRGCGLKKDIPALTGLRFFAAMAIVLHHSQDDYFFHQGIFQAFGLDRAVQMFFALSGFVLCLNAGKYSNIADFMVARFARVWPVHLFALLFVVWLILPGGIPGLLDRSKLGLLAINLALLQAWDPNYKVVYSYNAPSWSVSCEMLFYLLFLPLFRFMSARLFWNSLIVAAALILLLICGSHVAAHYRITNLNHLEYVNPIANLPIFVLGILTGLIFNRTTPLQINFAAASAIQAAILVLVLVSNDLPPLSGADLFGLTFSRFGEDFTAAVWFCVLFYALGSMDGIVSRGLGLRWIVYLGEISYPIYMVHDPILVWIASTQKPLVGLPVWLQWSLGICMILALSAAVHHIIERPCMNWIRHGFRRLRQTRVQAA